MTRCNEGRAPLEAPIYAVRSWPLPLRVIVHVVMACLGSIRDSPYPTAAPADKWCDRPAWERYVRWHLRNYWWDLRADILGLRWVPDRYWRRPMWVWRPRIGGSEQYVEVSAWVLRACPIIVLPLIAWRTDRPGMHAPWLPHVQTRWHLGWQDGRTLNILLRTHRRDPAA